MSTFSICLKHVVGKICLFFVLIITCLCSFNLYSSTIIAQPPITVYSSNIYNSDNTYDYYITKDYLEKSNTKSVNEALKNNPSINVRENGSFGQSTSVSLRGFNAYDSVFLINGVKLFDPSLGQNYFDVGQLPLTQNSAINITNTGNSVNYGSSAIAGAIDIITNNFDKDSFNLDYSYGSDNTNIESLSYSHAINSKLKASLSTSYFSTTGYNFSGKSTGTGEKDGGKDFDFNLNTLYTPNNKNVIEVFEKYNFSNFDYDTYNNEGILSDSDSYSTKNQNIFYLKSKNNINEYLTSNFVFSDQYISREYFENSDKSSLYTGNNIFASYSLDLIYKDLYLKTGLDNLYSMVNTKDYLYNTNLNTNYNALGYFINFDYTFFKSLTFTQGFRVEDNTEYLINTAYLTEVKYLIPVLNINVKAHYSQDYRTPSSYELYDYYYGNSNLNEELSQTLDLSFSKFLLNDSLKINAAIFNTKINNLIVWGIDGYYNSGSTYNVNGFETSFEYKFYSFNIRASYSYLNPKYNNGDTPLFVSTNNTSASVDYTFKKLNVVLSDTYHSKHYENNNLGDVITVKGYNITNIAMNYYINSKFTYYIKINNLFNVDYKVINDYNTKGITALTGLKLTL